MGLAVAKGLALADRIPLVLVSSLDALAEDLARSEGGESFVLPCIDAGKGQVYGRLYRVAGGRQSPSAPTSLCCCPKIMPICAGAGRGRRGRGRRQRGGSLPGNLSRAAGRDGGALPGRRSQRSGRGPAGRARLARGEHDDLATSVPPTAARPTSPSLATATQAREVIHLVSHSPPRTQR